MSVTETVADRIRVRLEHLQLSAAAASLKAGLGRSAIQNIFRGASESPRLDTLVRLAGVLDCSLSYLTEGLEAVDEVEAAPRGLTELAKVRQAAGLTQRELADEAGLHWVTVSKLERGRMEMTTDYILMFSAALQVPPIAIFTAVAAQAGCTNIFVPMDRIEAEDGEARS